MRPALLRHRLVALFLVAVTGGLVAYLAPGWELWATPATLAVSGLLAAGVLAAVALSWRGSPGRRIAGAALLLAGAGLLALDIAGIRVSAASPGPVPYEILMTVALLASGVGVLLRRRAARWVGLGIAAAGAVSSALNLQLWIAAGVVDQFGWALSVWALGGLAILASLGGGDVAAGDRLRAREEVWRSRDPLVRWTRAAIISAIVACPMLLVYAFMQAGAVSALAAPAVALAIHLAIAAALAGHGKVLGGVLLAVGALALVALATLAFALAGGDSMRIPAYYLAFWLPAAATGLASGIALVRAALRSPAAP